MISASTPRSAAGSAARRGAMYGAGSSSTRPSAPMRSKPQFSVRSETAATGSGSFGDDEIVAVDQLVAAAIAEDGFDLGAFAALDERGILGGVGGEAPRELAAGL